ncbi:MAG: CpaF family protein [Actinomycetota bacterium]
MKLFKKPDHDENGEEIPPTADAAGGESGITDLVDWYLNPEAPSPMVDQAVDWVQRGPSNGGPEAAAPAVTAAPAPELEALNLNEPIAAPTQPEDDDQASKVLRDVQNAISEPLETEYVEGALPVRFERPPLTEEMHELKRQAKDALTLRLGSLLTDSTVSEDQLQEMVIEGLADVLLNQDTSGYSEAQLDQLGDELLHDILGHGPIEPLLEDPLVSEIMVNGPDMVFVERAGKIFETSAKFESDAQVRRVIDRIVSRIGRRIDESSPMVDARLPDGSRVNAIIPPLAVDGSSLTIRKFSKQALSEQDLVAYNTLTWESVGLLRAFVSGKLNMLISGGTGSGKTTLLNVCSNFIPEGERVVTIEDSVELRLNQRHVVRLESRPANVEGRGEVSIRDLVKNSLRMRPDRIVVGECRSGEALDMLQAMNTGHEGSLTTLHANSPRDCIARLETLVLMAGMDLPIRAIREQIASAIDVVVQLNRLRDGTRRVTHITEVVGMEGDTLSLQDIFLLETQGVDENGNYIAELKPTGLRPMVAQRLAEHGIELRASLFGDPTSGLGGEL